MKQINANKNKNHSRVSLSGIFNACRGRVVQKQQNVEDPRLQISGMAPMFDNSKRAFTLIELLVVVLIIGILSAIALPQYQTAVLRSRYQQMVVVADGIWKAQQIYYLANNEYAMDFDALDIQIPTATQIVNATAYYPWGHCTNSVKASSGYYVQCTLSPSNLKYERKYRNTGRSCMAAVDIQTANQVCKNETGNTTPRFRETYNMNYYDY